MTPEESNERTTERLKPIMELLNEIHKAFDCGAYLAALSMVYVGIDTMAWISLPIGKDSHTRAEFIAWVDKYLKTDSAQLYQYRGIDLYAGRCALLHSYGSISDLHRGKNPPRVFGYLDNGKHQYNETVASNLVLISIAVLVRDFAGAVANMMEEMLSDKELRRRVSSRLDALHKIHPTEYPEADRIDP